MFLKCQYCRYSKLSKPFAENCRQTGVGWSKSPNLQFSRSYVFLTFSNQLSGIIVHYDNTLIWISADIKTNDLE